MTLPLFASGPPTAQAVFIAVNDIAAWAHAGSTDVIADAIKHGFRVVRAPAGASIGLDARVALAIGRELRARFSGRGSA